MIEASVVCDSLSPQGKRLTTFQVKCHRFILAEINTHRVLSRNYRSSRAVPSEKLIEEVRTAPAMPVYWGKNRPGMQAAEELAFYSQESARSAWISAARGAADWAEVLARSGLHKQIANRVLEPFLWVHGVITATEWDNFWGLRLHKDAQPEFRQLAREMHSEYVKSRPEQLTLGEWHLPYVRGDNLRYFFDQFGDNCLESPDLEVTGAAYGAAIITSVARCARVSYKPFDADRPSTIGEDCQLFSKLVGGTDRSGPMHLSPLEHQATPDEWFGADGNVCSCDWATAEEHGNFVGWRQYRKRIKDEAVAPLPKEFA